MDESVDVYVDDLQRFGTRMEVRASDRFFRMKFIESLPPSIYEWVLMPPDVYTSDFNTLVSKVRGRISAQKEASVKFRAAAASVKEQGLTCPRCTVPNCVRVCTLKRGLNALRLDKPFFLRQVSKTVSAFPARGPGILPAIAPRVLLGL